MIKASSNSTLSKYELVAGLEVHVQLSTKSKIFSSDSAHFSIVPNEHVSSISLGLPGTLPYLNQKVVEYAIRMGLATHCTINYENYFDRKHYFYADLPKGFQTTQNGRPICVTGYLDVKIQENYRRIRINRIHMEEDAGKSLHDQHPNDSLIDLNRAGVPLLEIVSEPDIRSAREAAAYLTEIRRIVRYLDICDGNMEEGSIRCDANISVRLKGTNTFGNRCEVKNLNSIRNLQRAIDYEFNRQIQVLESGETIAQNTLNFDTTTGITSPLRSKEMANDYRYFPEPDLQPLQLTESYINNIATSMPELPEQIMQRYVNHLGLSEYDALILISEKETSQYFDTLTQFTKSFKTAANLLNGPIRSWLNEHGHSMSQFPIKPNILADLIHLINDGLLNHTMAIQKVFPMLIAQPDQNPKQLALELNLLINTATDTLQVTVQEVLQRYPNQVQAYQKGKKGVLGLFMGEVMKKLEGKVDPQLAREIILQRLAIK